MWQSPAALLSVILGCFFLRKSLTDVFYNRLSAVMFFCVNLQKNCSKALAFYKKINII